MIRYILQGVREGKSLSAFYLGFWTAEVQKEVAMKAKRICAHPGCVKIVEGRYCEQHTPEKYSEQARSYDRHRGSAAQRGYDARWRRFAKAYLSQPEHKFCVLHISAKCAGVAQCVDHIKPLRGPDDPRRFDPKNLQPACIACNSLKGDREMRGDYIFGKKPG